MATKVGRNGTGAGAEAGAAQAREKGVRETLTISAPNFRKVYCRVIGTSPYVQNRFGAKARVLMHEQQAAGSAGKARKKKDPKNFQALYEDAKHVSTEGWCGIPAAAFRRAMVDACRAAGVRMTAAKQALFIAADGWGPDGTALVRIEGEPVYHEGPVVNQSGVVDLRPRPMWPRWSAVVGVEFDADMLRVEDVINLLARAGKQVGIGEGRPFSRESCGQGWGTFEVEGFGEMGGDE
jgi:hypothetical protein